MIGPLIEYDVFVAQINDQSRKRFSFNNFLSGIKLFSFGLFKKVILAETFALVANWGFDNIVILTGIDVIVISLCYSFQIYFDFSGYSDMAIGLALMMNVDLPRNFNSPYKAVTIRDFWKRWHMTLTAFFTKYIYIPLGGNKKGTIRTIINVLIVFVISGIWHGANWTFILWGLIWGVLSAGERFLPKPKSTSWKIVGWILTFLITNVLWLLFRADNISQWFTLLRKLNVLNYFIINANIITLFNVPQVSFIGKVLHLETPDFWMAFFFILASAICFIPKNNYENRKRTNVAISLLCALLLVICIFSLTSGSDFVYFGF